MPNIIDASQRRQDQSQMENPILGGGQSGIISPQSPQTNAKAVGSGQFTNLTDYITANQGGSENLGSAIESDVQNKASTAQNEFQQTINQNKPVAQEFAQARTNFQNYFNQPSLSQSDIENATRLRTGNTNYQNRYNSAIQNINTAKTGYNTEKQNLSNLGQGKTLTSYLKGFGENPSAKTMGEVGLTRFLVNQTQPGQRALQTANTIAQNMQANAQPDIQEISNAYSQISPDALQGYSDTQRQNYINSLGAIDKTRAGRNIASNLGISDLNQEQNAYNQQMQNLQNARQQYAQKQNVLKNINNLSEDQLYNTLNQEISSSKVNPYRVQSKQNPGMYLEDIDFNYAVPVGNVRNVKTINPGQGFYGGSSENLNSKDYNTLVLQNRLQNQLPLLQQQQADYQKALESNKYNQYQSQLANANTVGSALNTNEIARLQALQQLSGWGGLNEFLGGSI
jgi:hypothetical protein